MRLTIAISAILLLLVAFLLRGPLLLVYFALTTPHHGFTCMRSDPEARLARALSQDQLAEIFATVSSFPPWPNALEIPSSFDDLDALVLRRPVPGQVHIRLKACLDHHTDLVVYGADPEIADYSFVSGSPRIELAYGEYPESGREVLWSKPAPP